MEELVWKESSILPGNATDRYNNGSDPTGRIFLKRYGYNAAYVEANRQDYLPELSFHV